MEINLKQNHKGIAGVSVIQTNVWEKRRASFELGRTQFLLLARNSRFVAGLMLYWAEGAKSSCASISNSDPNLIVFVVKWFKKFYGITPEFLTMQLHLHTGQNEENMRQYWSEVTGIRIENFVKSYVKKEGTGHRTKNLYFGTVKIRVRNTGSKYLLYQIFGALAEFNFRATKVKVNIQDWIEKPRFAK